MDSKQKKAFKIKLLKAISTGQLPVSALNIQMGTYLKTDRPGIYQDNGHLISYDEVSRLIKSGCFGVCSMFTNDNPYPDSITISEGSENVEFRMETPEYQTQLQ